MASNTRSTQRNRPQQRRNTTIAVRREGVEVPLEVTEVTEVIEPTAVIAPGEAVPEADETEVTEVAEETTTKRIVFTPYQAHRAVNALLASAGVAKKIPPQMMYRYRADERFKSETDPETGKWVVDLESFTAWALPYVERTVARARKAIAA
jgi:hypothetical protein